MTSATMKEYVGRKINKLEDSIKFTQPVMLQSFKGEFKLDSMHEIITPAEPRRTLPKVDEGT